MTLLWVALGGAVGSVLRYTLGGWVQGGGGMFAVGTLFVNVTGAFAAGLLATFLLERSSVPSEVRTGLLVGVLGGYTTFSTFSLETLARANEGEWLSVVVNVTASVAGALLAVWLGQTLARL